MFWISWICFYTVSFSFSLLLEWGTLKKEKKNKENYCTYYSDDHCITQYSLYCVIGNKSSMCSLNLIIDFILNSRFSFKDILEMQKKKSFNVCLHSTISDALHIFVQIQISIRYRFPSAWRNSSDKFLSILSV